MLIHVVTDNHITARESLVSDVQSTLTAALHRFEPQIQRVEVHLADENSHKRSDDDKKCTLEARLAGLSPIAASATGGTLEQAIYAAADRLIAALDHKLGRLSDRKGRVSFSGDEATS